MELKEITLNKWLEMSEQERQDNALKMLETGPMELQMLIDTYNELHSLNGLIRHLEAVVLCIVVGFNFVEMGKIYKITSVRARQLYNNGIHKLQHPSVSREIVKLVVGRDTIASLLNKY